MANYKYARNIIKGIYPDLCPVCGYVIKAGQLICNQCEKLVIWVNEPKCEKCGKPMHNDERLFCDDCKSKYRFFDNGIAVFEHTGAIRQSIYRFKYDNMRCFAEYYAKAAISRFGKVIKQWNIDLIVPVPIYKKKKIKRGYNQALEFGKELSKCMNIPLDDKLLIRVRDTLPQKGLADGQRYTNLKDAFAVDASRLEGTKNILLVDDIFTTGSTVDECSKVLKKAGAKKVYVLCVSAGRDV